MRLIQMKQMQAMHLCFCEVAQTFGSTRTISHHTLVLRQHKPPVSRQVDGKTAETKQTTAF